MTDKISKDQAEAEFDLIVEMMDLEIDPSQMDEDDRKGFDQHKDRIIRAIMRGHVTVDAETGEPTFIPQRSGEKNPITFYEPTGAALMAMDRRKKSEDVAKLYAAMAEITRVPAATFSKMKMPDLKVCLSLATLFLA